MTRVNGTMVTATDNETTVTRNISWFKRATSRLERREENTAAEGDYNMPPAMDTSGEESVSGQGGLDSSSLDLTTSTSQRNPSPDASQDRSRGTRNQRYCLRPNPMLSQQVKDFVLVIHAVG